jgi:phosphoglycolate phosphatase
MTPFTLVFDLDGTLVDTAPDLVATLNHILTREGLPPVAYPAARSMVGAGARVMLERGLKVNGHTLSPAKIEPLVRDFIVHYAANIAVHSQPFAEVETTLNHFSDSGYRLAVCTNKPQWLAIRLLDTLGLSKHFLAICGPDTFGLPKPNPAILLGTIERAGGRHDQTVMVGDSITDIATARAANVPVIAVDFGYTDIPVSDLGPDHVISTFAELPAAVRPFFSPPVGNI